MAKKEAPKNKELEYLQNLRACHKGKWLTKEDAYAYHEKAKSLVKDGVQDVGERRKLREELQREFGLSEIEAINILNGYHISQYVDKYYRIQHLVVNETGDKEQFQSWLKKEQEIQDRMLARDDGWRKTD